MRTLQFVIDNAGTVEAYTSGDELESRLVALADIYRPEAFERLVKVYRLSPL